MYHKVFFILQLSVGIPEFTFYLTASDLVSINQQWGYSVWCSHSRQASEAYPDILSPSRCWNSLFSDLLVVNSHLELYPSRPMKPWGSNMTLIRNMLGDNVGMKYLFLTMDKHRFFDAPNFHHYHDVFQSFHRYPLCSMYFCFADAKTTTGSSCDYNVYEA